MSLSAEEFQNLQDMLAAIEAERGSLSDWERGFIDDQLSRVEKYGADTRLSLKQWNIIRRVYASVTEGGPVDDESD